MDLGLQDVHVLVTGASGGIGLVTARLFLEQGARVTAHYNSTASTLEPLASEYSSQRVQLIQANLSLEDDVARLFSSASKSLGPVQILINNHGYWPPSNSPLHQMSLGQWRSTVDINLTSTFLVAREYLRGLELMHEPEKEKTNIVLIGSTAGKYGEAGHADYAASKSAMMYGLTMSLKNEIVKIAPKGRVNCVAPGWTMTPKKESMRGSASLSTALATTPLKKFGTPLDVAHQIVLLSSSVVSGHVTGQVIMVEGGMEGRLLNKPEDISL